jgi:hypothetical protein
MEGVMARSSRRVLGLLVVVLVVAGCSGIPLRIPGEGIGPGEEPMGHVTGEATGVMLFQCIPIGQNDRFQSAYQRALISAPGATRLVDVTIQENWFWAWLLNGYQFKLSGTAVRPRS